jgi:hypothetical protein
VAKKFKQSFSEMVADMRVKADSDLNRRGGPPSRPGAFNLAGELFDPRGVLLRLAASEITPDQAADSVRGGALLAFESCGCGGGSGGGCEIEWFDSADFVRANLRGEPAFVRGFGSPTWIDLWSGNDRQVVFAHGDVKWGSILS